LLLLLGMMLMTTLSTSMSNIVWNNTTLGGW
jgi:hypothetical protein